jgi:hypothetical protein
MLSRIPSSCMPDGFQALAAMSKWGAHAGRRLNLVLWAFFDESGKLANSDFICLAGYICDDGWDDFSTEWGKLLKRHEIPLIHLAKLVRRADPYANLSWDQTKEDEVLREFVKPIRDHLLAGFGIGVDTKFYRRMPKRARKLIGNEDPQDFAFHRLLKLVIGQLQNWNHTEPISLNFDYTEDFSVKCITSLAHLRQQRQEVKDLISSIGFADDAVYYPLQAADMLAYGTNRHLREVAPNYFDLLVAEATETNPGPRYWSEHYDSTSLQKLYDDLRAA